MCLLDPPSNALPLLSRVMPGCHLYSLAVKFLKQRLRSKGFTESAGEWPAEVGSDAVRELGSAGVPFMSPYLPTFPKHLALVAVDHLAQHGGPAAYVAICLAIGDMVVRDHWCGREGGGWVEVGGPLALPPPPLSWLGPACPLD